MQAVSWYSRLLSRRYHSLAGMREVPKMYTGATVPAQVDGPVALEATRSRS